jgi:hypothetical protein
MVLKAVEVINVFKVSKIPTYSTLLIIDATAYNYIVIYKS